MIGSATPLVSNFQGFDFMTMDGDVNPFQASYVGAPYQVRATDPAEYGRAAAAYLGLHSGDAPASGVTGVAQDATMSLWEQFKVGAAGTMVGIVVVALGVAYILWGRD